MKDFKFLTAVFMGLIAIAIVVYDVIIITAGGEEASISNVLNEFFWSPDVHPLITCAFGFIVGGLAVHFLEWKPINYKK